MTILGAASIAGYARDAGFTGASVVIITAIVFAESGGDTTAVNDNGSSKDWGLAQINDKAHPDLFTKYPKLKTDPAQNMRAAFDVYTQDNNSFMPWVTFHNVDPATGQASYLKFLQQAQQGAGQGLRGGSGAFTGTPSEAAGIDSDPDWKSSGVVGSDGKYVEAKVEQIFNSQPMALPDGTFIGVPPNPSVVPLYAVHTLTLDSANQGGSGGISATDPNVITWIALGNGGEITGFHVGGAALSATGQTGAIVSGLFDGLGPALWIGGGAALVLLGLVMLGKGVTNPVNIAKAIA